MDAERAIFTLRRHLALIAAARADERRKIAQVLRVEANTIGGVIGAAFRAVAGEIESAAAALATVRSDAPSTLSPAERAAEIARLAREFAAEDEVITAQRAVIMRREPVGPVAEVLDAPVDLPPERQYDDESEAHALLRGRRLPPPKPL